MHERDTDMVQRRKSALQISAEQAVQDGFVIFPCEPGGKRPVPAHWLTEAKPVARGWAPDWNIGIACGPSGLVVVDLDIKSVDGIQAFREFAGEWPDTYETETPSGGRHLYFDDPGNQFGNGTGTLPPGIDVRGRGGYVLAAGSIIRGKRYRIVNDADIAPVPGYLQEALTFSREVRGHRHGRFSDMDRMSDRQIIRALNARLEAVRTALPGERTHALFTAACRFGDVIDRIDESVAEEELMEAAADCGLTEEYGEHEIMRQIRNGLQVNAA